MIFILSGHESRTLQDHYRGRGEEMLTVNDPSLSFPLKESGDAR